MKALAALLSTTITYLGSRIAVSRVPIDTWFWPAVAIFWIVTTWGLYQILRINEHE